MFLHPRMHLLLEVRCFEPKKLPGRSRGSSNGGAGPLLRFVEDPFFLLLQPIKQCKECPTLESHACFCSFSRQENIANSMLISQLQC